MDLQEYSYLSHPVFPYRHTYYCRALNAVLNVDTMFCEACPLMRGFTQGEHQGFPECYYYDSDDWNDSSPAAIKKRIDREILLGHTGDFPRFDCGDLPLHRILEPALQFAAKAHKGAFRKGTQIPYIAHPLEAATIATWISENPAVITAAALHDVLEDTPFLPQDIEERFGSDVLELVMQESEDKREHMRPEDSWRIRKEETLETLAGVTRDAQIVALCDKLSNMRQMKRDYDKTGDKMWRKFNQKNKAEHAWYYKSIQHILKEQLGDTAAFQEYAELIRHVFHENEGGMEHETGRSFN